MHDRRLRRVRRGKGLKSADVPREGPPAERDVYRRGCAAGGQHRVFETAIGTDRLTEPIDPEPARIGRLVAADPARRMAAAVTRACMWRTQYHHTERSTAHGERTLCPSPGSREGVGR